MPVTPFRRGETIDAELVVIRDALELSLAVAREDARNTSAPRPPRRLSPMLDFHAIPDSALVVVKAAVDGDAGFRGRVADRAADTSLGGGSRLYLERPEGWREALSTLVEHEMGRAERGRLEERSREAEERLGMLADSNESLLVERDSLAESLEREKRAGDVLRERLSALERELSTARGSLTELEGERAESVRQLKVSENLARRRLGQQRELERQLSELAATAQGSVDAPGRDGERSRPGAEVGSDPYADATRARLAPLVEAAAALMHEITRLGEQAGELAEGIAELLGPDVLDPSGGERGNDRADRAASGITPPGDGANASTQDVKGRRPRRSAPRPGRGLALDTPEGLTEMLSRKDAVVLIDGYNVSMAGWPGLAIADQRASLVAALGGLQARSPASLQVVFDGEDTGVRPSVSAPLPVRVHFTQADVEADDRLIEFARSMAGERPVMVVSSDNRVREGAVTAGAGAVSSATLLALVR